ncbi:oxygen-dependent tRNA uridine(34) hydroxylase TrhO [Parasphingopyxis sp.]|uniref:oxygen-dependent tRNA uridine(34) hydroxylase TrhO n=1 Tax=Parasphingopyxis sp. TaxID=1920299 RepID=UPI003F9F3396
MSTAQSDIRIAALYRFTPFEDLEALRDALSAACRAAGVKGTLLLAPEGINGTIAGTDNAIEAILAQIRSLPGCADLEVKFARAAEMPFHRMKVRIKREIVTMGEPDIDPARDVGDYVAPEDWNALISDPDTILIDTRNDYEVAAGTFENAIDPKTPSFRDFPAWFRENRKALLKGRDNPRVAMFCTGGIRCEKATALLKAEGLEDVFHLKGGILKYLETVDPADSRWRGECFVFDERVTVTHGLERGSHVLCRACRMPVSEADRTSPFYVEGIRCPACHDTRTEAQRRGYAERQRQSELAAARGETHVGAELPGHD